MARPKPKASKALPMAEVAARYQISDRQAFNWQKEMQKVGLPWTWEGIERFKALKKENEGNDHQELKRQKLQREVQRLDIKIERERGELVLKTDVQAACTRIVSVWCAELDALVADLPGQIGGLSETEVAPKLRHRIELLKRSLRTLLAPV